MRRSFYLFHSAFRIHVLHLFTSLSARYPHACTSQTLGWSILASDVCRRIHRLLFYSYLVAKAVSMYTSIPTEHDKEALSWFATQYRHGVSLMQCYFKCLLATIVPSPS
ncbi:hypothetical protein DE146DRAFT_295952 [Phaeosphaeria sp. MPI-PUGE-AT-0046c]|nr:hypothetical protein DE146DRAFT_295952 [Phaeosphaeria sp. MPI-PUGE-AT-0046c]